MKASKPFVCLKQLKITQKFFPRSIGYAVFPEIRLSGKWLQELGFKPGDYISLKLKDGEITISPSTKAEEIKNDRIDS